MFFSPSKFSSSDPLFQPTSLIVTTDQQIRACLKLAGFFKPLNLVASL